MATQKKYKSALKNKWNTESEKLVKQIGEKAQGYIWMCERDAVYYSRLSTLFTVAAAFLSLAVGTGQILYTNAIYNKTATDSAADNVSVQTALGVLNYVVGGLIAIMKLNNFETLIDKFKQSGAKFRDISADIQQQLSMQRVDRFPANEYIKLVSKKYNSAASDKTLAIRRKTAKNYMKEFSSHQLTLPEISGDINPIVIAEPRLINGHDEENPDEITSDISESCYTNDNSTAGEEDSSIDNDFEEDVPDPHSTSTNSPPSLLRKEKKKVHIEEGNPDNEGESEHTDRETLPKPHTAVNISGSQVDRIRFSRKKTKKSVNHPPSAYFQHHNHNPNLNSIQYQLTRLSDG